MCSKKNWPVGSKPIQNVDLTSKVVRCLQGEGLDWQDVYAKASQIIVFGSYALSAETYDSDLDILCIGEGRRHKTKRLHLIWVSEDRTRSPEWCGSELATHIAAYGRWIKGTNKWGTCLVPNANTIRRKERRIVNRAAALNRHWRDLLPGFRRVHLQKLRRDLQRLVLLRQGDAPVPKGVLDKQWEQRTLRKAWTALLAKIGDFDLRIRPVLRKAQVY